MIDKEPIDYRTPNTTLETNHIILNIIKETLSKFLLGNNQPFTKCFKTEECFNRFNWVKQSKIPKKKQMATQQPLRAKRTTLFFH